MLNILRLTLSLGSRSGQMSNFDVFVWQSLASAISIFSARNSAEVASKGWWRYPVSMSFILSMGQDQGQVTKGHKRSSESKILFGHAPDDLWTLLHAEFIHRSHFAIWLHASQRQGRVGSTPGHIRSKFRFFEYKNVCSKPVWSQDSKNAFLFLCNAQKFIKSQFEK